MPLWIALVVLAQAGGAALAAHATRLRTGTVTAIALGAAVSLLAGSLAGRPAGFVAIALGYGAMQLCLVVAEARLQHAVRGTARATVTSVAGLASEVLALAVFAAIGLGSRWLSTAVLLAALAGVLADTALLIPRRLPRPPGVRDRD